MKKIAVVILNFKLKEDSLECIDSVKNSSYQDLAIYVVDNNSKDGLEEELSKQKDINFIQSGKNLGYTGGNNLGIKKALDDGAQAVVILNPDTTVDKNAIENLAAAEQKNGSGIYGPKIYFDEQKTIWYAGGILDLANVLGSHRGVDQKDHGQYDQSEETDYVSGAAMLVSKQVFEAVGLFDERYFLYLEDADLCYRAKQAGYQIRYVPKAMVFHKNARSTKLGSPLQDYFITRNRFLFASKFLSFRTRLALFREGLRNLSNPARKRALFDALIGNFGKGSLKLD